MATVVSIGPDRRWAELGQSLENLAGGLAGAWQQNRARTLAANAVGKLAAGKSTPMEATAELLRSGMSAEEVDRLLSNVYQESRFSREQETVRRGQDIGERTTTRGQDVQRDIATEGEVTQRRGQDIQFELGTKEIAAANARANASIASQERMQGRSLSMQERLAVFDAEKTKELEGMRITARRNEQLLGGAIQQVLGREQFGMDVFREREGRKYATGERVAGEEFQRRQAERGYIFQSGQAEANRTFERSLEEYRQGKIGDRELRNLAAQIYVQTGQQMFTASENAKDRALKRELSADEIEAARIAASKPSEQEAQRILRLRGLASAAASQGIDVGNAEPAEMEALAFAYDKDSPEVLKDYIKQLGIDTKVLTPDGLLNFEGTKVGGLERLKLEKANELLPKLYIGEMAAENPDYQRGTIFSQLVRQADTAVFNPKEILPSDMVSSDGKIVKSVSAAKYLRDQKGFTREDVKRWLTTVTGNADPNVLDTILEAAFP